MKFSIKDFSVNVTADLVMFTEEIYNGKLYFLCSNDSLKKECPANFLPYIAGILDEITAAVYPYRFIKT